MNFTYLEQFRVIARCENMAKASEILHVSQPALSYSVSRLEEELGVKLFDRGKNRIRLNDAGKRALGFADAIFEEVDRMTEYFERYNAGQKQLLRIVSASDSAARNLLPRFMVSAQDVRVQTSSATADRAEEMLLSSECDVAMITRHTRNKKLREFLFYEDELYVALPKGHRCSGRSSCRFSDLAGEDMILPNADTRIVHAIRELAERNNTEPLLCDDYVIFKTLCCNTDNLFFVSGLGTPYYEKELAGRTLVRLTDEELTDPIFIAYPAGKEKKAAPFLRWLEEEQRLMTNAE